MTQQWDVAKETASAFTLTGGNLVATQAAANSYAIILGTEGVTTGKYYWECTNTTNGGNQNGVGIANSTINLTTNFYLGQETHGLGYYSGGQVFYNAGSPAGPFATFAAGQLVCVALDLVNSKIWWRLGTGGNWNNDVIGNQNPATNTGGVAINATITGSAVYPAIVTNLTTDAWTGSFAAQAAAPGGFGPFDPVRCGTLTLLGVGCGISLAGLRMPTMLGGAALLVGKSIRRNAIVSRRELLGIGRRL
jgi:hypothetical protein